MEPRAETNIKRMFSVTLIPLINHPYLRAIPYTLTTIAIGSVFCPLVYPAYYPYDPIINSIDLAIVSGVYPYISYIYLNWEINSCFEHISVSKLNECISLGFYVLFMLYWLFYTSIQFAMHQDNNILIQVGNVYMSASWYIYFSTCSLLYYFVCIKLSQRTQSINNWLKSIKRIRPSIDEFYNSYKQHHKAIKTFGRGWNFLVFMGFIILTYHIPIDLINVIVNHKLNDIAGILVKSLGLGWYTYKICELNDMDTKVISYLYKHELYDKENMEKIEKYATYHELGLRFYGIKINGPLILKIGLLTINLIIPTIYALITNKLISS
jgi:hypothetical protein